MTKNKIKFIYSSIYDEHFRDWIKQIKGDLSDYPSRDFIVQYLKDIEDSWRKIEASVLLELSNSSNMSWDDGVLKCYIVGNCIPFSDPLTLKPYDDKNIFIDKLVHELIHELFLQNSNRKKYKDILSFIENKYPKESKRTKLHIPLYALHTSIYYKLFTKKRMDDDIKFSNQFRDYKRAWDIVNKAGYKDILTEAFGKKFKEA
ncbi:hypothetical protein KAI92_03865 [Candidatus Parcubacteria bacterium]|nr:hypothetical protein [Candidatus Parcubacteria bacterium]